MTLTEAITKAGSLKAFGDTLDPPVTAQAVQQWKDRGWVPIGRVSEIVEKHGVERDGILPPAVREAMS